MALLHLAAPFLTRNRIHMIPLMPFSTLTRTENFVLDEWATYFADGQVDPAESVIGGWKGIL